MTDMGPPPPPPMAMSFWDREFLGLKFKYAIPLFGVVLIGGIAFFLWYRNKSVASASGQSTLNPQSQTLSTSGAQLAAAGLYPYYGTGAPTAGSVPQPGGSWTTRGDTSYGAGTIPVVSSPNPPADGSGTIAQIPETTALQSLGISMTSPTPVSGTWPGEGNRQYYSVTLPGGTQGYVLTQDLMMAPNPTNTSSFYSGATSMPSGLYPTDQQQQGFTTASYPYATGFA